MDHNSTSWTEYAPLWVSEPNGRGTWSILYSCLFTLSICVWSAIHLNIPPKKEADSVQYWRKTKWVFIAIFAPELVLYSAWQQYYLARRFQVEMQNICREQYGRPAEDTRAWWEKLIDRFMKFVGDRLDESKATDKENDKTEDKNKAPPPKTVKQSESANHDVKVEEPELQEMVDEIEGFSLRYGFYVVMGGFVVDVSDVYDDHKASWLTITPRGVINLARSLPWSQFKSRFRIDEDAIRDKSKADCLAKILVFLQVLWAAVNSISRVVLNYPISVLEIHTLVHAGCAMLMYALWFKKPLDIKDATEINTEAFKDKLALMLVRSPGSAYAPYADLTLPKRFDRYYATQETQGSSTAWREWPDTEYGSEAAFLCFDTHRTESDPNTSMPIEPTYSIIDTSDDGQAAATDIAGNPSTDRVSEQDDYEATIGFDFKPSRTITAISRPAFICRAPMPRKSKPKSHRKSKNDGGLERFYQKLMHNPQEESVHDVQRLVTGEMLSSGIGPNCLITRRGKSAGLVRYEDYTEKVSGRFAFMQGLVDRFFKPAEEEVVEVSNHLKTLMPFPDDLHDYNDKSERTSLIPDKAYFHKMAFSLSEKDILRWNRACAAFRTELAETLQGNHGSISEGEKIRRLVFENDGHVADAHEKDDTKKTTHSLEIQADDTSTLPEQSQTKGDISEKDDEHAVAAPDNDEHPHEQNSLGQRKPRRRLRMLWSTNRASGATLFSGGDFCVRSRNLDFGAFGRLTDAEGSFAIAMFVVLSDISSLYAGIHLALWFHEFPTREEALLWKISAVTLGVPAPILVFATIFFMMFIARIPYLQLKRAMFKDKTCAKVLNSLKQMGTKTLSGIKRSLKSIDRGLDRLLRFVERTCEPLTTWFNAKYESSKRIKPNGGPFYRFCRVCRAIAQGIVVSVAGILIAMLFGPLIAAGVLYCFARVYIVVESFLSLRHVPVGVYQDVSFAQYIPHL